MITKARLLLFDHFGGLADGFTLLATEAQRAELPEAVFGRIADYKSKLILVKNGHASAAYAQRILDDLRADSDAEAFALLTGHLLL